MKHPRTQEEINQFFEENERLIHAMLKPYKGLYEYDDLFQEAAIGFFKGIKAYEPGRGTKLTTFCFDCARNEVKMYLRKNGATSRTAELVPLEYGTSDGDSDSHLNHEEGYDTLRPATESLDEIVARKDLFDQAMAIVGEMSYERQVVIQRFLEGVPQSETAKELNTTQGTISKILKATICELVLQLKERGIIDS